MSHNLHQAGGRKLSERGFGKTTKGKATVIALSDGTPATMQPTMLFNKAFGGTILIVPEHNIHPSVRGKSYLYSGTTIYEVSVDRGSNNFGTARVNAYHIDKQSVEEESFSCGFLLQGEEVSFITCCEMEATSEEAKRLIDGILFNAFAAAVKRSFDQSPQRLYYGNLAKDANLYVQQARRVVAEAEEMVTAE